MMRAADMEQQFDDEEAAAYAASPTPDGWGQPPSMASLRGIPVVDE